MIEQSIFLLENVIKNTHQKVVSSKKEKDLQVAPLTVKSQINIKFEILMLKKPQVPIFVQIPMFM